MEYSGIDRTLVNKDITEILNCDERTAYELLTHFGHRSATGRWWIGERELLFLRMEGKITEWLKETGKLGRVKDGGY